MSTGALILGSITGLTYAILAVGIVLIYRANRFVNFAHGSLGALASVLFAKLVIDVGVPYFVALVVVVAGAGLVGGLIEIAVIRRLFSAPRLVLVVATIALAQLLYFLSILDSVQPDARKLVQEGWPLAFRVSLEVGGVRLTGAHVAIVVFVPLLAAAITAFLRYTAWGQAIRAAAENPDAARLAGISVKRTSTIVWVIAGVLAAFTGLMFAPLRASSLIQTMGPGILVRALGAALVARMSSLPIAFGAAVVLGIAEAAVFAETSDGGTTDLVVFAFVVVALVVRGRQLSRSVRENVSAVGFGAEADPLPPELAASRAVQRARRAGSAVLCVVAVGLPFVPVFGLNTSRTTFLLTLTMAYAVIGVSLTILTGWAGQVSLGHFALVGVGAFVVARLESAPLPVVILAAGSTAAVAAVIVGLPALRIQGLFLAVATLAFGVLATGWLFQEDWFVPNVAGTFLTRPSLLRTERAVYFLALAILAGALFVARNLRRHATGRMLIAVRDNDVAARSAGISAVWTRLISFAISGFLAGCAGVVFAYARQTYNASDFQPVVSLTVILMVAVGGLGSLSGAVLGAVFMFGLPALFGAGGSPDELITLLTSSVGVLVVLLYLPGGLASLASGARDAIAARLVRREQGLPAPPRALPPLRELWRTVFTP